MKPDISLATKTGHFNLLPTALNDFTSRQSYSLDRKIRWREYALAVEAKERHVPWVEKILGMPFDPLILESAE